MKFNFKKIASVLTSTVMLSSTLALAAAASFPAPFVKSGAGDVAIVYGSSPLAQDQVAVLDINTALTGSITTTSSGSGTASGGDSYKLEKTSTKFHIGDAVADVISVTVNDDDLDELLADGTFTDDDNDEFDFTQKITLANWSLTMFDDNDYKADAPTVGVRIADNAPVLNYTLDFSDNPLWTDLETSDLSFMGKTYYVLSTDAPTNTTITLLDSADSLILNEGETKSVTVNGKTYDVSINFIGSTSVKLDVNGEVTNSLNTGSANTFKLKDGTYVGIKEINVQDYAGGSKNVEFSIGSGKLKLVSGAEVEINDDAITGLSANFTSPSGALGAVDLIWKADNDLFVTEDSDITMPGFGAVKLSSGGVTYPAQEEILVEPEGDNSFMLNDFPLKDSTEDINLLYWNGTEFTVIGKDSTNVLRTDNESMLVFNGSSDSYFVASWSDGDDAESYLMRATSFTTADGSDKVTVQYKNDGVWKDVKEDAVATDDVGIGSMDLTLSDVNRTLRLANFTAGTNVDFHTLYSKEGLKVFLPFNEPLTAVANVPGAINLTTGNATATFALRLSEEDKDGNKGVGRNITLTLADNANDDTSVTNVALTLGGTSTEIGSSDVERNFVYSALATEVLFDKGPDQQKVKLVYHGSETEANLFLTAPSATVGGGGSTGTLSVKDSEVSSVSGKNLIVVGGSCINTVAASLLGSSAPLCGANWEAKTNVGAGSFLIQTFASPYSSSKIATLVAGYNQPDTANAAKYLTTQSVDVEKVGTKLVGTAANQATLVTS